MRHPAAHLHVEYQRPDKVYDSVRDESADLGLVSYPEASRDIAAIPWRKEEMQVAVSAGASLRFQRGSLAGRSQRPGLHRIRRRPLDPARAGQIPADEWRGVNMLMHFDNIQTIKEAVALGSGISILPARTMQAEIAQGRLVAVKLHAPDLHRPVGVLHRRRRSSTRRRNRFWICCWRPKA